MRTDGPAREQVTNPSAAPGELELVRTFVNTLDIETGTDGLDTPGTTRDWLAAHGHALRRLPGPSEVADLRALREAIRQVVMSRGTPAEERAVASLDRIAARYPITVSLGSGMPPFTPRTAGVGGFVERLLGALAAAGIDGSLRRLKACPNDRCHWLFYDHSRNGSRAWCSMDVCGARAKMRTYRAHRRASG